jgi:hypothetical protein
MEDEKIWHYIGRGDFIDGIPARDLTAADWARLGDYERVAVEQSPLYRRAPKPKVEEPAAVEPAAEKPVEAKPAAAKQEKGKE